MYIFILTINNVVYYIKTFYKTLDSLQCAASLVKHSPQLSGASDYVATCEKCLVLILGNMISQSNNSAQYTSVCLREEFMNYISHCQYVA